MGESMDNEAALMPYIHSANIACGYHAGDITVMQNTIDLCCRHNVRIGAHPSFPDKENFGRKEMKLTPQEIYELVTQQLIILQEVADPFEKKLHHVKPHGALYNMSARDSGIANAIAKAVKDFDPGLILYGLSGSISIWEAKELGLKTASEVFADRTYQDDGSLTPRSAPDAFIHDAGQVVEHAMQMVNKGMVTTVSGRSIPILAETICIHGDGEYAVAFAQAVHKAFNHS